MRPPGEPLPPPLRDHGGPLADVFARWLRQRDDPLHAPEKALLTRALLALSDDDIRSHARHQAAIAMHGGWPHWSWAVPASTVASLLGMQMVDVDAQQRLHDGLRAMAAGLAPQADGDAVQRAGAAVEGLWQQLDDAERRAPDAPLQWTLLRHAPPSRWTDRATFAANRLALIWQSHEAGAALLGHALIEMKTTGRAPSGDDLLRIARDGGAVRSTRRFDGRPGPTASPPVAAIAADSPSERSSPQASSPTPSPTTVPARPPASAAAAATATASASASASWAPMVVPLAGTDHPFGDGAHRCPGQGLTLASLQAALTWLHEQPGLRLPEATTPLSLSNMDIPQFLPADAGTTSPEAQP